MSAPISKRVLRIAPGAEKERVSRRQQRDMRRRVRECGFPGGRGGGERARGEANPQQPWSGPPERASLRAPRRGARKMARRGTIATTIGITTRGRRLFPCAHGVRVSSCSTPRCEDGSGAALQDELYAIGRSDDWSGSPTTRSPFVSPFELTVLAASRAGEDWAAQRRACALAKSSCAGDFSLRMGDENAKPRGARPARPAPTQAVPVGADGPAAAPRAARAAERHAARARPRRARRRSRACSARARARRRRRAARRLDHGAVGAWPARARARRRRRRPARVGWARAGCGSSGGTSCTRRA